MSAFPTVHLRKYTRGVPKLAEPPAIRVSPEPRAYSVPVAPPTVGAAPAISAPTFYITGRQPLSPSAILLAVVVAGLALFSVLFTLEHTGHTHWRSGADNPAHATSAADDDKDDDPNQVDTIVLGDPSDAPEPARPGTHPSPVHPTIIVRLPRWGEQVGFIPNSPAGHLLYDWLAAFNHASYPALASALPNFAVTSATSAQMELRRHTGGFTLVSAREVQPGLLVFRLHDQTPAANEVLGTLWVRPKSSPATIASFSLRAVPSHRQAAATGVTPLALPSAR
jgi:hypothetical protein